MAKGPTISTITAAFASASKLNANFNTIDTAFDNTLSRDGSTPNTMAADLDINSNNIVNVNSLDVDTFILGGTTVTAGELPAAATTHDIDTKVIAAATSIDTGFNFIRTSGFSTVGDGGHALYKAVDSEPSHALKVQSNDGQWWELVPGPLGFSIKQAGAFGDNSANDATAINNALTAAGALLTGGPLSNTVIVPQGIFLVSSTITGTNGPFMLTGAGWQVANDNSIGGSVIKADGTDVTELLVIQSDTPASQTTTNVEGVVIKDFALFHRGSGRGLNIDNVIRAFVTNVHIDCNNEGAIGLHTNNWGFFSTFEKIYIDRFTDVGLQLGGQGSQHIVRDCHIQSSHATAVAALEIRRPDFLVSGGQYSVNLAGDTGIGIHVNNKGGAFLNGGRIMHTLCEKDIAVKITGTTDPFNNVVVAYPRWNMSSITKGVIFDRCNQCVLFDPEISNPDAGGAGVMAEWTALSVDCGVVCNHKASRSNLTVNASATRPWMRVTGTLDNAARDTVTTNTNLTVTIEHLDLLGETIHNGTAWDKQVETIADDAAFGFLAPKNRGTVKISTTGAAQDYALLRYNSTATGLVTSIHAGSTISVLSGDAVLAGTTGADATISIQADSASGKIYVENRSGGSRLVFVTFVD